MKNKLLVLIGLLSVFWSSAAFAFNNYDLSNLNLPENIVGDMLKTASLGSEHRSYSSATPLGYTIGLEAGVEVTATSVPSDFKNALSLATGTAVDSIPSVMPVPQLSIRKGFPFGLDVGFSFATSKMFLKQDNLFSIYGGDIQWAFLKGEGAKPAVAARFGMTMSKLWFMKTSTYGLDVVASKNLYVIDPYIGAGLKFWSGSLELQPFQELPLTVSGSKSGMNPHFFVGLPVKLTILHLTFEADYNTSGITSYGSKISLNF